jgi:hypothetical protein
MPFSAKRPAYSDSPSEASQSVIVATGCPLAAAQREEDTSKPDQLEGNTPILAGRSKSLKLVEFLPMPCPVARVPA